MMPTSKRMVAALIRRKDCTTSRVGSIGVKPVRTTKVRNADSSAIPTANGASSRRQENPLGSASDGSNEAAGVSALVIPEIEVMRMALTPACPRTDAFISHLVAELRQFRG